MLHRHRIIHRDLKPSNILCSDCCQLQLCDFGLSCTLDEVDDKVRTRAYVVSRRYRPPELLCLRREHTTYGQEVDVWSMGCVIGEIYGRAPLFVGSDERKQRIAIERRLQTTLKRHWLLPARRRAYFETLSTDEPVVLALDACLREKPHERKTAAEIFRLVEGIAHDDRATPA